MSSRIKPKAIIVANAEQVEGSLAEMAAIERKLAEITSDMNAEVDAAKKRAKQASLGLQARYKELGRAIKVFAVLNESTIFHKDKKSLDLYFGVIGFQSSTEIVQIDNVSPETTIAKLREFGWKEGLNIKESVLKSAMANWSDEKLQSIGLRRKKNNIFYIDIKHEKLPS